jgi:hypothetical protein
MPQQGIHSGDAFLGSSLMGLIGWIFWLIEIILILYCLIDVISKSKSTGWKVLWVIVIFIFPIIGSILYILIGKNT